ncbi:MAG: GGDEF domain-containing protein [Chloroflexi bacterium]|nr:GGDEF domain-containing protein [Chloroflexota bacterium]
MPASETSALTSLAAGRPDASLLDTILEDWSWHVRVSLGGRVRHGVTLRRVRANMRPVLTHILAALADRQAMRDFDAGGAAFGAAHHFGELRLQQGFQITEMLHEFRQLRREIVLQIVDTGGEAAESIALVRKIDDAVDRAAIAAAGSFHAIEVKTLAELVAQDPPTGLYDYGYFWERLEQEVQRIRRRRRPRGRPGEQAVLCLLLIDIDLFKGFNDRFGHLAGDLVIKRIAAILAASGRRSDVVARYGGDEFALILPDTPTEGAMAIAERIRAAVATESFASTGGSTARMTVSGGCAEIGAEEMTARELVGRADGALYIAKSRGRNQIVMYDVSMPSLTP